MSTYFSRYYLLSGPQNRYTLSLNKLGVKRTETDRLNSLTLSDTSEEEEDEGNEEEEDKNEGRQYYLRQHKPRTNLYEAPPIGKERRRHSFI